MTYMEHRNRDFGNTSHDLVLCAGAASHRAPEITTSVTYCMAWQLHNADADEWGPSVT